jgi:SOS-response transcriptional repressor LexA
LPGDILIVDLAAIPQAGDVVSAHVNGFGLINQTIFRIYEPPSLVSATFDPTLRKPLPVDQDLVRLTGVVVGSFRERNRRVAA